MDIENELTALYVLSGRKSFGSAASVRLEKLPFELFICVKSGTLTVTTSGFTAECHENETAAITFDTPATLEASPESEIFFLGADFRIYSSLRIFSLFDIPEIFRGEPGARISSLCKNVLSTYEEGMFTNYKLENSVSMNAALYSLEKAVLDISVPKQTGEETLLRFSKLAPVFRYIRDEVATSIMQRELSELIGGTNDMFYRVFKSAVGYAPKDFIISEKLSATRIKLISGNEPIGKLSEDIGYSGQFYYSTLFKKKYGVSPTEYRRKTAWLNE